LKNMPKAFEGQVPLEECLSIAQEGSVWEVKLGSALTNKQEDTLLDCYLKGELSYRIDGIYSPSLSSYDTLSEKEQKKISTFLSKNKIPSKMKGMFPFIVNNEGLVECDFCFNLDLKQSNSPLFSNIILKM